MPTASRAVPSTRPTTARRASPSSTPGPTPATGGSSPTSSTRATNRGRWRRCSSSWTPSRRTTSTSRTTSTPPSRRCRPTRRTSRRSGPTTRIPPTCSAGSWARPPTSSACPTRSPDACSADRLSLGCARAGSSGAEDRAVDLERAVADGGPRERVDGPGATGTTEGVGAVDVGHRVGQRNGEVGHEPVRVDGRPRAVLDLLDRHEPPGLTVDDDLRDATRRGRDDGELARHGLEVDDAERLVDRRAGEDGAMAQQGDDLVPRQHVGDPDDALGGLGRTVRGPQLRVDPVVHHMNPRRIEGGVALEDVRAHTGADRDDGG